MLRYYVCLFLLIISSISCFPQQWKWAETAVSGKPNWSTDIELLSGNNAIAGGVYYNDSVRWQSFLLQPYVFSAEGGSPTDCYILSIENDSVIHWAKSFGSIGSDYLTAIDMDTAGNIYCTGYFGDTLTYDNDTLPVYAPQGAYNDVFILKLDSAGNLLWKKSIYGTWYERGEDIHVYRDGILVTGNFTDSLYIDTIALLETSYWKNFFLVKYSMDGNVEWVNHSHGKYFYQYDELTSKIQTDKWGNIYVSGHFQDSIGFGSTTIYGNGGRDIFIACFDSSGNVKWLKNLGSTNHDYSTDLNLLNDSILLICGTSKDTLWYNALSYYCGINSSIFYSKIDTGGNIIYWDYFESGSWMYSGRIGTDSSANIYLTGFFYDSVKIKDSTFFSPGFYNIFIVKIRGDSVAQWIKTIPDIAHADYSTIGNFQLDEYGNLFLTGGYMGNPAFDSLPAISSPVFTSFISYLTCYSEPPELAVKNNLICPEDTIALTGNVKPWQSLSWQGDGIADTVYANNVGFYMVRAIDENGCASGPDSIEIMHHTVVDPVLDRVCDSVYFIDSLFSVRWYLGDSLLNGDTLSFLFANKEGNYFITGEDSNGCYVISDTIPYIFPDSLFTVSRVCDSLFKNDVYESYQWYFNGSSLIDDTINYLTATINGSYSLLVSDSNECIISSDTILYNKADSIILIDRECDTMFVSGNYDDYSWFFNGINLPDSINNSIIVSSPGNYSLTVMDSNKCSILSDTIYYVPPDSYVYLNRICDSIFISNGYSSYSWYFQDSLLIAGSNYLVASLIGFYSVIVVDSNNCSIKGDTVLYTVPDSLLNISGNCDTLFIQNNFIDYSWYFNGNVLTADSFNILIADSSGIYTANATDSIGCIIPSDSIMIILPDSIIPLNRVCDSLFVPAFYESYQWFYNGNLLQSDSVNFLNAFANGDYLLIVKDSNGCSIPTNNVDFDFPDSMLLLNQVCDSIFIPAIFSYQEWYFNGNLTGDTLNYQIADASGIYSVSVMDSNNCIINSDITYVSRDSLISINLRCDSLFISNDFSKYNWYYNGALLPGDSLFYLVASENGEYNLIAYDSNSCIYFSDTVDIYLSMRQASMKVYPNPVENFLYVEMADTRNEKGRIEIKTTLGEKINEYHFDKKAGEMPGQSDCFTGDLNQEDAIILDFSLFETGIYFLVVTVGNESGTYKIIKL